MAAAIREKLQQEYRCLYLNSPPMVAGMRSSLATMDLDVLREVDKGALVLSSERDHLRGGSFDVESMMSALADALNQALADGYAGLWATGDMTWEFGPENDFSKLLEYEWRLEEFFQTHPQLSGVCHYHADTMPREAIRQGLFTHPAIFINHTLSLINPHFFHAQSFTPHPEQNPELESVLGRLLQLEFRI